jgi:hypothetical protein
MLLSEIIPIPNCLTPEEAGPVVRGRKSEVDRIEILDAQARSGLVRQNGRGCRTDTRRHPFG